MRRHPPVPPLTGPHNPRQPEGGRWPAGGWQPLCAVYRRSFAEGAETALRAGHNKIDRLFDLLEIRVIDEDELVGAGFSPDIFRNLNTPEELEGANASRRTR